MSNLLILPQSKHFKTPENKYKKKHGLLLTTGFSMQSLRLIVQEINNKNCLNKNENHQWVIISREGDLVECDLGIPVTPYTSIKTNTIFTSITLLTGDNCIVSPALSAFLKRQQGKGVTLAVLGKKAKTLALYHHQGKNTPWLTCSDPCAISTLVYRLLNEVISVDRYQNNVDTRVDKAITLMRNNIEEPLPPKKLAVILGVSHRQLERLFRKHTNTTISRYYTQLRLWEAKKLLQTTYRPLLQTGLACGFSSASHFSRAYRDYFGIPPGKEKKFCVSRLLKEKLSN